MDEDVLTRTLADEGERVGYGSAPSQFGDLRLPQRSLVGPGPYPLVLVVHGGFWRARYSLSHLGHLCAALCRAGFATFNVEYRRMGQAGGGFPGSCEDVLAAAKLGLSLPDVEPRLAVLLGHSAGGQLALWAGKALAVSGVVALAAVSDLRQAAELGLSNGAALKFVGGAAERYAEASPLERLPLGVPQILVHGTEDETVPFSMSEAYVARAKALGDPAELSAVQGAGHFALVDPLSVAWPATLGAVRSICSPR